MFVPKVNTGNSRKTQLLFQSTYINICSTSTVIYFTELNFFWSANNGLEGLYQPSVRTGNLTTSIWFRRSVKHLLCVFASSPEQIVWWCSYRHRLYVVKWQMLWINGSISNALSTCSIGNTIWEMFKGPKCCLTLKVSDWFVCCVVVLGFIVLFIFLLFLSWAEVVWLSLRELESSCCPSPGNWILVGKLAHATCSLSLAAANWWANFGAIKSNAERHSRFNLTGFRGRR